MTNPTSGISRRTLATGAAWTVPTLAVASAAPAYAASDCVTCAQATANGTLTGTQQAGATKRYDLVAAQCITGTFTVEITTANGSNVVAAGSTSGNGRLNGTGGVYTATYNGLAAGTYLISSNNSISSVEIQCPSATQVAAPAQGPAAAQAAPATVGIEPAQAPATAQAPRTASPVPAPSSTQG